MVSLNCDFEKSADTNDALIKSQQFILHDVNFELCSFNELNEQYDKRQSSKSIFKRNGLILEKSIPDILHNEKCVSLNLAFAALTNDRLHSVNVQSEKNARSKDDSMISQLINLQNSKVLPAKSKSALRLSKVLS